MSTTDQDMRERSEGQLNQQLLESSAYQNAFIYIKAQILHELENTPFHDGDIRNECWRELQTLKKMEARFSSVIRTGKLAEKRISMLQKAKNKAKTVMGGR